MKALTFDGKNLTLRRDYPEPAHRAGWAVIGVRKAGICRTDLELTRGYMGFNGVLGHEFVGEVAECEDSRWIGRRVAGEINAACGACDFCRQDLGRHCPNRSVLGILNLDGCFAEYCALPIRNLHEIPENVPDDEAVFTEPVSAACEILDQVPLRGSERCVVLGDGKLGILCAWVLTTVCRDVTLVGHHAAKLTAAQWNGLKTTTSGQEIPPGPEVVVEATGSGQGLMEALRLCRPRGTLVLKSTIASAGALNLAPVVINELNVVGSRCGRFERGLTLLRGRTLPLSRLIHGRYPLDQAGPAFEEAARRGVLKILIEMK